MRTRFAAVAVLFVAASSAQEREDPYAMDYGPVMTTTLEAGGGAGTTTKALVVRLGDAGAVAFDTELLRLAAGWTDGWLRLRGTAYDGSHGPMPSVRGRKLVETRPGPGWAHGGSFADPRPIPYGPLPREHARYHGVWLCGDSAVVGYRVGDMDVREAFALAPGAERVLLRTIELGPSAVPQVMVVGDGPDGAGSMVDGQTRLAMLQWQPAVELVELAASTTGWQDLPMGGPSRADHLDAASGTGASIAFVPGFARAHGRPAPAAGGPEPAAALALPRLGDGEAAANDDDWQRSVWFDARKVGGRNDDDGRYVVDLQQAVAVTRVNTFTWHRGSRSRQQYELYGSDADAPDAAAPDPAAAGWQHLASVDSGPLGDGDRHGVGIWRPQGLGRHRHLLFDVKSGGAFFSEVDVFSERFPAPVDAGPRSRQHLACALHGDAEARLDVDGARLLLRVAPHPAPLRLQLRLWAGDERAFAAALAELTRPAAVAPVPDRPAPARWGGPIATKGQRGAEDGPFSVDTITVPFDNRFGSRMRTGAFDFFVDGRAAVSTWNGDVWIVSGIDDDLDRIEWKRYATGLFDPLGLRIVDGVVHVHGRDGITRLHDLDGDGEADFYECFNNMVYATPAFHEFAFDLQTDADGNFYCSKGAPVNPGGRGFMAIAPHHGTILKIAKDGSSIEAVATGLRAPNGIGLSPTGVLTSGDNEGTFMPRCRINWIERPGFYAGVKDTAHRMPVPDQPDLPLCWLPMEVDNSSGGQVWVTGAGWPDLAGRLLHLSYGTCSVLLVLKEDVDGQVQGGVVRLPAEFSSSCMRGRFAPHDGQLYVVGLRGWQTSAAREGGFHRVRRTTAPLGLPIALRSCERGVYLTFAEPLDPETAADSGSYGVEIWNYRYSPNYGSPEVSLLEPERSVEMGKPNRDPLPVRSATLSPDRRTVLLAIDGMRPVHQIKITWNVDAADGAPRRGELHASIHALARDPGFPAER